MEGIDVEAPDIGVLSSDESLAWDLYFATCVGMAMHPGNDGVSVSVSLSASLADEMLLERRRRRLCR